MSWQPPPPPPKPGPGGPGPGPGRPGGPGGPGGPAGPAKGNFYDMLQVTSGAHPTIIRYAYRFLAGIYHPDNVETGNADIFRQITEAFKTLSDSGRRAAYDAQLGPAAAKPGPESAGPAGQAKGPGPLPHIEKTSLSYNEIELRLAILQMLLQARKKRVQTGGCSAKVMMDVLGTEMSEMEFALWYLREKGYIERYEAVFMITVIGVDYIVDQLTKTQIIDEGPKNVPPYPGGGSSPNLPIVSR